MENTVNTYVIQINLGEALLPSEMETVYNLLFWQRYVNEKPDLTQLLYTISISTRLRKSLDDNIICIFYKFDHFQLPRFTSPMLSIYNERLDKREFRACNKSHFLLSTPKIRLLQACEQGFLLKQIDNYLEKYKKLGKVQVIC